MSAVFYIVLGIFIGILGMAFLSVLNSVHRQFHEIEWHDAQQENPLFYVEEACEPAYIRVLVCSSKGTITDTWYYPSCDKYDFFRKEEITHFAYIDEVKRTVPPCPVCSGATAVNSYDVHANPRPL